MLRSVAEDIRFAFRMMTRSFLLTVVAVLSLALGIGATIAIFSVMYGLALRRLPVQRPDQLVAVVRGDGGNLHTYAEWKIFRDSQNVFSEVFAYNHFDTEFGINTKEKQEQEVSGLYVSGNYFRTLGVGAVWGRVLQPSDDEPGALPVCVLGYGLWRQSYQQSRDVLGRTIFVDGNEFQVVGVAPRSFYGVDVGDIPEIFMPLEAERTYGDYPLMYGKQTPSLDDEATMLSFFARLKPEINVSQVNAGLQVLSPEIYRDLSPNSNEVSGRSVAHRTMTALPIPNGTSSEWQQDMDIVLLLMVMATVALVVACANLGNLLLARATKRQAEIATRLALGASRLRLVRQLLTESLALSLLGAAAGLLIERWGSEALLWLLSFPGERISLDLSWDAKLVAFVAGITLSSALLFGLAPAMRATRISLYSAMNNGVATGKRENRFSNSVLVILQVALSMALLVSAGLLARTLHALLAVNPGYDPSGILLAHASWRRSSESAQHDALVGQELLTEFRSQPGVISASWSRISSKTTLPQLTIIGPTGSVRKVSAYLIFVSSESFQAKHTPILAGREFNDTDKSLPVAILSKDLAMMLFPALNPIGLRFYEKDDRANGQDYPVQVLGVVGDIQYRRPGDGPLPILYRPVSQCGDSCSGLGSYAIRVAGSFAGITQRLQNVAASVDPDVILKCNPMTDAIKNSVQRNRAMELIAITFGLFVGLLTMIGIYGVTSYMTAQRTREIGVRMTLGAQPRDVLLMILGETTRIMCIGLALGVGVSIVIARLIQGLIWGVKPLDPLSFAFAVCLILLIVGIAAFFPARRAMRVDPMDALRFE